ncbi:SDR family oxidoreductase [Pendulispora albinea]|uniref:SDR family oxidoreductase n=1 Tax=Pendulispora albinea TaxID=2741071 RepID=A0ABZ2M673_9BACT
MRIFVTGASGFVGTEVVRELLQAGHEVVGLARSDSAAKAISDLGAITYRGDLEEPDSLRRGASEADAVIHTGFNHDYAKYAAKCEIDRKVIEVLGSALHGSSRPLIVTSALGVLPTGHVVTEQTMPRSPNPSPRAATEEAARASMDRGVNVSVVRLPLSTHGKGDHAFVPMLIDLARDKGISAYIADGQNRWPAVHRTDAAKVYRLAVERRTPGAYYHAIAEEGVPFREIAEVIGRRLNIPVVSKSREEAAAHFTWFAHFAAMNVTASSQQTRERLQWRPTFPGLIADIDQPYYFE